MKNDIPHSKIKLKIELQVVAIKVTLHRPINLCSIYLPQHQQIDEDKVKNLIQQVPKPFILLGDFNSHSTLRRCKENDTKGNKIENFINKNDLHFLNQKNQKQNISTLQMDHQTPLI